MTGDFTVEFFLPLLFLVTLLAVLVFSLLSKKETQERRHDPKAEKSTLAADGPDTR